MLSCFSRPRDKHDADGGTKRRHRRRINPAALSDAHSASSKSDGAATPAAAAALNPGHDSGAAAGPQLASGPAGHLPDAEAAPPPPTPPPTLPRVSRTQQAEKPLQQPPAHPEPLSIAVARPSWASENSSLENAAWVAGRRHRRGRSGDSDDREASFTSARSSFSSAVSGAPTETDVSGFWPPYGPRDPGSAAPSTRGGSEDGSPRSPRPQIRRVSWYVQHYGADYGALDYDRAAVDGELNSELDRAAEAAALAIGWRQDGTDSSHSGAASTSSEEDGTLLDGQQQDGVLPQRRVSWPNSQLPPLDPHSPEGLIHHSSWERGRGDDETASTGSADSAALVQELVNQAVAAHAEGRLLRVRELLRQAAERHGCSFGELLADGAAAAFGPAANCPLDLQQLGQDLDLIRRSLSDAQDTSGYDLSSDGDLRVLYRHVKGSGVHSFRFEAVYDCPVSHMLAITREFDLLATWNKMALDPAILGEPSIFANIVYTGQWMPFPLSELDLVVRTNWSDLLEEEGAMLITMADHSERVPGPGLAALPRKAKKRRRIQLLEGSSSILQPYPCTEDGQPRCRCAVLAHLNPHVPTVPGFIISFVLKVLSPFIYNATKQLLATSFKSPDLELPRRMAANPQLYAKVDERFRSPPHGTEPPPPVGRSLAASFRNL